MSKIGSLLKKILKKKKTDQDLDEIFFDESELSEETVILPDNLDASYDNPAPHPNQSEEKVPDDADLDYPESQELMEITRPTDPATANEGEDENDDLQDYAEEYEEYTDDEWVDHSLDDVTAEIDLDNDTVGIRDRIEFLGTRVKDRFRNLNKKDLNQAFKNKQPRTFKPQKFKQTFSSIDWSKIPQKLFDEQNLPKYHRWFQIALVAVFVIASFTLLSRWVAGNKIDEKSNVSYNSDAEILDRLEEGDIERLQKAALFKTQIMEKEVESQEKAPSQEVCTSANKRSSLSLELVDTYILQDSVKSIASVQKKNSKKMLIGREGDVLNNNVEIGKIETNKMIFRNLQNQNCEFIEMKNKSRRSTVRPPRILSSGEAKQVIAKRDQIEGIAQEGNDFKIKRAFLKSKLADINSILSQARGVPIKNPDGTMSFKITDVDPAGMFAYLGVQNNDIITQINGEPIKELNEVMNLFAKITSVNNLSLSFQRQGETVTQNYTID